MSSSQPESRRISSRRIGIHVYTIKSHTVEFLHNAAATPTKGDSVAEWLACWTQAQKGLGSNLSRDIVR